MKIGKADRVKVYVLADDYAGYNSVFWSQHGVSFLVEVEFERTKRRILFDTASYAEPILHNMKLLKIDPKIIDMIVLSHSHFDHTGGLLGIMKEINKETPIFAHPSIFKVSFTAEPEFIYAGIPPLRGGTKDQIEKLGGIWVLSRDPIRLTPGAFTLGEIEKEEKADFEKKAATGLYRLEEGRVVLDEVEDEIGLGIVTEKGLIVIIGCSHPGIVSMAQKAVKISGVNKVHAIIGGLHLINASDKRIQTTAKTLKSIGVEKIYAGHCTGLKAEATLQKEFKENFEKIHSGKIINI